MSVLLGALVGGTAVIVALTSGSLSLLGFGFDSAIDSVASVALVWRFRLERTQPHRAEQVERVAEGIVGGVLVVLAAYLAFNAIGALSSGARPEGTTVGTGLLLFSVVVLPRLALAKFRTAKALSSGALKADSFLTGIAALLALISLIGLVVTEALGIVWADAIGALIVAVVLVREGWGSLQAIKTPQPI
ncbi:MAG TPA: cation transporter [Candidatus Limnocylindrales bacterium]|nr:cation transporter [Candidatus Limnocylindrales bacterium]